VCLLNSVFCTYLPVLVGQQVTTGAAAIHGSSSCPDRPSQSAGGGGLMPFNSRPTRRPPPPRVRRSADQPPAVELGYYRRRRTHRDGSFSAIKSDARVSRRTLEMYGIETVSAVSTIIRYRSIRVDAWCSDCGNTLSSLNVVALLRARLLLGWVTVDVFILCALQGLHFLHSYMLAKLWIILIHFGL